VDVPPSDQPSRLSQTVTFPDSITFWVRPAETSSAGQPAYGVEFQDGLYQLWVLFGEREGGELVSARSAIVHVRAPFDEWSRQTITPAELYAQFGWALPDYSVRSRQGIEFAARQVMISLLVSDSNTEQVFGPIEQDPDFAAPRALVAHALAHPDEYYVNLGNEYCRQRNTDLAREAFLQALIFNPDSIAANRGLVGCR
jgi:hypothetical protein